MASKPRKKPMTVKKVQQGALATYHILNRSFETMIADSGRESNVIQRHLRSLFFSRMKSAGITKTVEIGAFEAGFSRQCRKDYPDIPVIAFEANPYVHERFKDELAALGVDYRFACAADKKGKITFTVPRDFRGGERPGDSQMASIMSNLYTENSEKYDVDSVRIDDAIDLQDDDRLSLWIDVEGATEMVFSGMTKTLERTAMIFIEVERRALWEGQWLDTDVFTFLSSLGFVPIARDTQSVHQYNYIYLNPALIDTEQYSAAHYRYLTGKGEYAA